MPTSSRPRGRRRVERLARLDEPGERRIAARRPQPVPPEQAPVVVVGDEHDHRGVGARVVLAAVVDAPAQVPAASRRRWLRRTAGSAGGARAIARAPTACARSPASASDSSAPTSRSVLRRAPSAGRRATAQRPRRSRRRAHGATSGTPRKYRSPAGAACGGSRTSASCASTSARPESTTMTRDAALLQARASHSSSARKCAARSTPARPSGGGSRRSCRACCGELVPQVCRGFGALE